MAPKQQDTAAVSKTAAKKRKKKDKKRGFVPPQEEVSNVSSKKIKKQTVVPLPHTAETHGAPREEEESQTTLVKKKTQRQNTNAYPDPRAPFRGLCLPKAILIPRQNGSDHRMLGLMGLQQCLARLVRPASTARHLPHQLKRPLGGPQIGSL